MHLGEACLKLPPCGCSSLPHAMHRSSWLATTLVSSQAEKDAVTSKMQREWSAYSCRMRHAGGAAAECTLLLAVGHSMAAAGSCRRPGIPTAAAFCFEDLLGCCFFFMVTCQNDERPPNKCVSPVFATTETEFLKRYRVCPSLPALPSQCRR